MAKTADYTRKAIDNYNAKFDRITVNLPKGCKDIITAKTGKSATAWARDILVRELERLDESAEPNQEQETVAADQQKTETEQEYLTPLEQAQIRVTLAREKAKAEQGD